MLLFILKSSACLAIFLVFYKLFLEQQSIHVFKRFYLLGSLVAALSIPLITFTTYVEPAIINPTEFNIAYESDIISNTELPVVIDNSISIQNNSKNYWSIILWSIYGLGILIFSIQFIRNLYQIIHRIKYNPKHITSKITNVLLKEDITPHTFLRYIFFNKQRFDAKVIPQEVFWHEETHAKQRHSIDILLVEILQIIFWFNPFIHFIKKSMKLNHEFLADKGVLNRGVLLNTYQQLLLEFSTSQSEYELASAINYPLIKKRFTIMKTQTSKRAILIRSLILLPILAITLYSFSNKVEVEKQAINKTFIDQDNTNKISNLLDDKEASQALMDEYRAFIEHYKKTNVIIADKYKRARIIYYNLMSDAQRESVEAIPKTVIGVDSNLSKVEEKQPTKSIYENWKNKINYAVWLDNKVIENSQLNTLDHREIVYYTDSFVYENARSERFPQSHQVHLFTKDGFDEIYKKSNFNKYNNLAEQYSEKLKAFLKGDRLDNSELKILYHQGEEFYKKISQELIGKYNVRPLAPPPAVKREASQQKTQQKTSKKNTSYKVLKTPNKDIVLLDHWYITIEGKRYYYPYKGDIKKYYDKNGNEVSLDIIEEYKKMYKSFEALKNKAPHYVYKTKAEQEEMDRLFSDLGGMYFRTPRAEKYKIIRPESPLPPYVRLEKDGQVYYKKKEELTEEEKASLPKLPPSQLKKQTPQKKATSKQIDESKKLTSTTEEDKALLSPPPAPAILHSNGNSKAKGGPNSTYQTENYNVTSNTREEFLRKFKQYEALRYARPHFLKKSKADRKLMSDLWLELRQMLIYSLSKEEKKDLKYPITPFAPYVRVNYDGKSYYKVNSKLTSEEKNVTYSFGVINSESDYKGLDLLKEDDPIVIPIGSYTLEPNIIEKEGNKRHITITVSENGEYTINEDRNYKNFKKTSLASIEDLIAKLSKKEIQNTFVFSKSNDYKKFRSKPSKAPEYQDDIEITLIKTDIRFPVSEFEGKYRELTSVQLVLDNRNTEPLKPHVQALAEVFKKYGITNITL